MREHIGGQTLEDDPLNERWGGDEPEDIRTRDDVDATFNMLTGWQNEAFSVLPESTLVRVHNGDGTWTLSADQLDGLSVTPAADSGADFQLTVTATSQDGADTTSVSETLDVTVNAVADAPDLTVDSTAAGTEDGGAIALDIASSLTDADGSETLSLTVSGVPEGATLSAGTYNEETGDWTLTPDQLEGLTVTPATDSGEDFQLTVTATSTEGDGGDTATILRANLTATGHCLQQLLR
mgnify:CR=1 FL=1